MKKLRVAVIVCAVIVAFIAAALVWCGEKVPEYQGKELSEWLKIGVFGDTEPKRSKAKIAIEQIGTNALPYLLEAIDYERTSRRMNWIGAALTVATHEHTRIGFFALRCLTARDERANIALYGFQALGSAASPAIPKLKRLMAGKDKEVSARAMEALAYVGDGGMVALLGALTNYNQMNRGVAASCVFGVLIRSEAQANATSLLPIMVRCLRDNDAAVIRPAAASVGYFRTDPAVCVPALAELTAHRDREVRAVAMISLSKFGRDAEAALPYLMEGFSDSDLFVRMSATNAVEKIAPKMLTNEVARKF